MKPLDFIFDCRLFSREEQRELAADADAKLGEIEHLLYRMEWLALMSRDQKTQAEEREKLQKEMVKLQKEIDKIAAQLPCACSMPE